MKPLFASDFQQSCPIIPQLSADEYVRRLHPSGRKGRPCVMTMSDGRPWTRSLATDEISAFLEVWQDQQSYISLNRFDGTRREENLTELNALYVDLDFHTLPKWAGMSPMIVEENFRAALLEASVPSPSAVLHTGRGISAIWLIKPVPARALPRWRAAVCALVALARLFGADPACTDSARVFRLPGTTNEKSGRKVIVSSADWIRHDFDRLSDQIFMASQGPSRTQLRARKKVRAEGKAAKVMPRGLTAPQRFIQILRDLEDIRIHHGGIIPAGQRNTWLHLYAVSLVHSSAQADIEQELSHIAALATRGLKKPEVRSIVRSAVKQCAAERTRRYNYAGDTIATLLDINADLARRLNLRQIMPIEERRRRRAASERQRRTDAGAQPRSQWLAAHSVEASKPWVAEGISRSTWYNRKRKANADIADASPTAPDEVEVETSNAMDTDEAAFGQVRVRNRGDLRSLSEPKGRDTSTVPAEKTEIRQISDSSATMDDYVWMRSLTDPRRDTFEVPINFIERIDSKRRRHKPPPQNGGPDNYG